LSGGDTNDRFDTREEHLIRPAATFSPSDAEKENSREVSLSPPNSNLANAQTMLREMVAEALELKAAAGGSVTDAVAAWLAPQYLLAAREKLTATDGAGRFEVLRIFMQDWAMLRRGDHSAARLQLDREELDWQRASSKTQKEKDFREWIQRPEVRREFPPEIARGISRTR
jgi:hypothetical protein